MNIRKSVLAGILISIGAMFALSVRGMGPLAQGLCFSVGLFGVLCCGARLFTGSVLLSANDVWRHKTPLTDVVVSLSTIWAFNMIGAVTIALMASQMGFDGTAPSFAKAHIPEPELLLRSTLCNVMVCMAVHMYNMTGTMYLRWIRFGVWCDPILNALACCVLPVACFVACGFEHSVADMFYMPLGLMQGAVSLLDCVRVICVTTLGNLIGGVAFAWMVERAE